MPGTMPRLVQHRCLHRVTNNQWLDLVNPQGLHMLGNKLQSCKAISRRAITLPRRSVEQYQGSKSPAADRNITGNAPVPLPHAGSCTCCFEWSLVDVAGQADGFLAMHSNNQLIAIGACEAKTSVSRPPLQAFQLNELWHLAESEDWRASSSAAQAQHQIQQLCGQLHEEQLVYGILFQDQVWVPDCLTDSR